MGIEDTDNLSFYHKVLLPGLLLVLAGMGGSQIYLIQAVVRLETQMEVLQSMSLNRYTSKDAEADWKLQKLKDQQQDNDISALENLIKTLNVE